MVEGFLIGLGSVKKTKTLKYLETSYLPITMSLLRDIEENWVVSKILVTANAHPSYLAFKLGGLGIYVHKIDSIITDVKKNINQLPMLVETRSEHKPDTQDFVLSEKEFKAYKIFKHGTLLW